MYKKNHAYYYLVTVRIIFLVIATIITAYFSTITVCIRTGNNMLFNPDTIFN